MAHIGDEDLEEFAMQTLLASETGPMEQHLLICSACRDLLESTDQYVAAMKAAAAKIRESGTGHAEI